MIEAQVQSVANGAIMFDRTLPTSPDGAWFDRAKWSSRGGLETHSAGRGEVAFVETPVGACVLRHYHRGGLAARMSADRYLWTGAARTRAFREFRLLADLVNLGLPVSPPVAARYVRDGLRYRADLLTRRIENAKTLAARLANASLDAVLAQQVGHTIARMHAANVWHADLNAHNILVDGNGVVWLIDFDRGRMRKPKMTWQQANIARLRRSLDKLGAKRHADFDSAFWHPLLAAYHERMSRTPVTTAAHGIAS
ncbi:MAG: 3-deoxy-D-manno-octulosonic acid kinase [Dokdonella sp.]